MSATTLRDGSVKARRRCQCFGCLGSIAPGEFHQARAVAERGTVTTFRMHARCHALFERLVADGLMERGDVLTEGGLLDFHPELKTP